MTTIVVRNTTNTDVVIDSLGFTVPPSGTHDVSLIDRQARSESAEFVNALEAGTLLVIKTEDPETYWDLDEAKLLITIGINKTMVNLEKVENTLHNFHALNPPQSTNNTSEGYSKGSIWIASSAVGFRAWVCAHADSVNAVWGELTQPPIHPGVVENRYYGPAVTEPLVSDEQASDLLVAVPLAYPTGISWNRIGIDITTAVAGGVARLGVYSNVNARPGQLLLDAGFVTIDTVGKKEIVIDFENPADWFWLAVITSQPCEILSATGDLDGALMGLTDPSHSTGTLGGAIGAMPYGPLPANFPTITDDAQRPPYIWLRRV